MGCHTYINILRPLGPLQSLYDIMRLLSVTKPTALSLKYSMDLLKMSKKSFFEGRFCNVWAECERLVS